MIRRPSLFFVLSVRHPRLPLGMIWLPIPSCILYALAWVAAICLSATSHGALRKHLPRDCPVPPHRMGAYLVRFVGRILCSGSYVLLDMRVPAQGLEVRLRLI